MTKLPNNKQFFNSIAASAAHPSCRLPSVLAVQQFAMGCLNFLFPVRLGAQPSEELLAEEFARLQLCLANILMPVKHAGCKDPHDVASYFFGQLDNIYQNIINDAQAIYDMDPAASSLQEVILAYPGFVAIAFHRFAYALLHLDTPTVPRLIAEYGHQLTGIDIHPAASIGQHFAIDHGTGIVIGATAIIGNNVKIYQGVTLGAVFVEKNLATVKRHPTIEDNVTLYAGCTILGGNTIIGAGTIIGGNVWLTDSVPTNAIVYNRSEVKIRTQVKDNAMVFPDSEPLNWVI